MKKAIKLLFALLLVASIFSCGDDDKQETPEKPNPYKSQIVGKWIVTDLKTENEWTNIEVLGDDYTWVEFKSSGDYHSKEFGKDEYVGTWSIKDNVVTCKSGDVVLYYTIVSLERNRVHIKLSFKGEDGFVEMKAKKK